MKKIAFIFLFSAAAHALSAQASLLQKGDLMLNAGIGLGSFIKVSGGKTSFPPLSVSAEFAINEEMTVGGIVGYSSTTESDNYIGYRFKYSHFILGARANYYFITDEKHDLYAGAVLGYNIIGVKLDIDGLYTDEYAEASALLYGAHLGGRYKFSGRTAVFAELGYGLALLNAGITFSLNRK